ncbi:LysM peptidoglycan-binding domain-containing protein [Alkaliphilus sp. B6464]|nr:LysM peptidoglycan-binding domain-containing protein [Alkaliphilus sp. B6464]QUH20680.1 LysM peptidoglycan-binding domain-containing protein [Alkaliphilus sp. B6464]
MIQLLKNISKGFYDDYSKGFIMKHNDIKNPNQIKIGQKLLVSKI